MNNIFNAGRMSFAQYLYAYVCHNRIINMEILLTLVTRANLKLSDLSCVCKCRHLFVCTLSPLCLHVQINAHIYLHVVCRGIHTVLDEHSFDLTSRSKPDKMTGEREGAASSL